MKIRSLGLLLTCACVLPPTLTHAVQVEADFNDMKLGNTRTVGGPTTNPNYNNLNTGKGFATGADGEYNNDTGVVLFEKGDLPVPPGVVNFFSNQGNPIDPLAQPAPSGVNFGSSSGGEFSRMQERRFSTAMTGTHIWFSFIFRLDGPGAQGQLTFNQPATGTSDPNDGSAPPGAFGISMGHVNAPGAIAINLAPRENPSTLVPGGNASLVYYDGVGTADHNGNGQIDGVDVGKGSISNIRSHVIIGRITYDGSAGGQEIIDVWLDPANGADPTGITPTLTATSDELPAEGLFSIAFRGTRAAVPAPTGGPYTTGGHFSLDHVRISDDAATALQFVTGNLPVDPKLIIATDSPNPNFNFEGVYSVGNPIITPSKTVKLQNTGATQPITINSIAFQNNTAPAPAPFVIENPPTLPLTLLAGESVSITMHASSSTFEQLLANTLLIGTSVADQNKGIQCAATFYSGGSRTNANPSLNTDFGSWLSDDYPPDNTPPVVVSPGFIGSPGMIHLHGANETNGSDNLSQTLLNGAKDWEFTCFMSPLDVSQFTTRVGHAPVSGDRTFQVVIQSNNLVPAPASNTLGTFTDANNGNAGMINLAYMPGGAGGSTQPGFYLFNGSNWQRINLPAIEGSIDVDSNRILNANPTPPTLADTVRAYLLRIKGTGFGTSQAKYSVSISQPNSTLTAGIATDLAIWSSTSGQSNTPGAYTFMTGDISRSGSATAARTGFWFDEVGFFSVEARDPDFSLAANQAILSHNGITTSGTVALTNSGFNNTLEVSALSFSNAAVMSSPQTLPFSVAAGTTVQIPVDINLAGFTTTNNAARVNLTLTGNVDLAPTRTIAVLGAATTTTNQLGNWNFEVLGNDPGGDNDSFAIWDELPNAVGSKDVPGLTTGSNVAAFLGRNCAITNRFASPMGDFVIDLDFAIKDLVNEPSFQMQVGAVNEIAVPLVYHNSNFYLGGGEGETLLFEGANLVPSVDQNNNNSLNDDGDTKILYKLRFTGTAWNTLEAKYKFEVLDSTGTVVVTSEEFTRSASADPVGVSTIRFQNVDVANANFWVDNVRAGGVIQADVIVTGFSKTAGGFNLSWNSGGSPVVIERSTTLLTDSWQPLTLSPTDQSSGTHSDATAPAGHAFYRIRRAP